MEQNNNQTEYLQHAVSQAIKTKTPLQILGGGSKAFYARLPQGDHLCMSSHKGVVNYHPSELVITARAGTLLTEIETILSEQGQMLAFEPACFSPLATLGGVVASGFSGPARPFIGSVRDFVLGCTIIDGHANVLSFGGEVMKNVAGYDVSRLMVGAMGTLGVLLDVSLKVLPKPEIERTQVFELNFSDSIRYMSELFKTAIPLSGLNCDGKLMYVRLSGSEKSVIAACKKLGGIELTTDQSFWQNCNEHRHEFFNSSTDLWRISVPPVTEMLPLSGQWFYEWGGGQRWLKSTESSQSVFAATKKTGGHAGLFRAKNRACEHFQPMSKVLKKLNKNIKNSFDPKGIFNPYRLNQDW